MIKIFGETPELKILILILVFCNMMFIKIEGNFYEDEGFYNKNDS